MLKVIDRASLASALNEPNLDPDLRALIPLRVEQLGHDAKLFVIQGGDTPDVINAVVGFAITGNDPVAFNYNFISDHGRWFEIALILDDVSTRIFVENDPGTELGIHGLCLSHFWPDGEGEGR
ncbi:hypothetical protein [Brevundimonas sp.]|uniref:hypothetical protein n=1 Tax=Brevundimonas sp. TaxID=1871086 RepID=UPI00356152BE